MSRAATALAMAMGLLILSGCAGSSYVLHYRLTLVFDVDGVTKSGSSIVEAIYTDQSAVAGLAQGMPWQFGLRGEAVVVDLGSKGLLFCLLTSDPTRLPKSQSGYSLPLVIFPGFDAGGKGAAYLQALRRGKPTADVDPAFLPMLVRFRDINDPTTVERVDPLDLTKSFGPGVRLISEMIEITDEPVTTGLEKKLIWLAKGYPEKRLVKAKGIPEKQVPPAHLLIYSDFERGVK